MTEETNEHEQPQPAITIEAVGSGRVKMQSGRIIAVEKVCSECRRLYWLPVRATGPFRMSNAHALARMGGAAVINKYG